MKTILNADLKNYTTFKLGGIATTMYIPQSIEEVLALCQDFGDIANYIIGGGSNLLVNDRKTFVRVLNLCEFNSEIKALGNGRFYVGASVRLQQLIHYINSKGYGGIEYLISVPGLVGGAIYMNAGLGAAKMQSISSFVESVECIINGTVNVIEGQDCGFGYRTSAFQQICNAIICGVTFSFRPMEKTDALARIRERNEYCNTQQDRSLPTFGTQFLRIQYLHNEHFSKASLRKQRGNTLFKKNTQLVS